MDLLIHRQAQALANRLVEARRRVPPPPPPAPAPGGEAPQERPKDFIKRLGRPPKTFDCDARNFDELDDWGKIAFKEMAEVVGANWDLDEERDIYMTDMEVDRVEPQDFWVSYGREEWHVYQDEDAAKADALADARRQIEEGMFNADWLENYIDTDRLKRDLSSDVEEEVRRYLEDQYSDDEAKRDLFLEDGSLDESDCYGEDEDGDQVELPIEDELLSKIERLWDEKIEAETEERLSDPVQYLKDIFGDEDGIKQAMEIGGIDTDRAAEDAVDENGVASFLASYDDDQTDLPSGAVAFRHN